ncbi:DUF2753 domain-containing protein [Vibrio sp. Isolate25]|uniref:DUF2753 domain-containing protein n=1 Tax=Vibrio TaxID=662 RepID=UPI001EFE5DCA|nr:MULTISPECIES: DUF2753 domain-containing protein [Vibrio]MCG9597181.1 DUF2753 domain-containing protein [Vibrio sp. Isolate25]MCG9678296.1 DUF2753 domain-containing protein [Vibrio sp. Isolate24]USD31753.1 DUF2753 domain-containing protein [Vibrio sp. SCSIO 43186]USD44799.1 DUF2753 domain-containing protein [Vibrio sp. SCSIO 43145]USD68876.1 DUF2753 domain-containing protein [Vibrio sp. SCSIO 43139]
MGVAEWEKHTLLADIAMNDADHLRSILHYQQALTLSERISDSSEIDVEERLMISVISCHNMASFWRTMGDTKYELKYLQLASEKVLTLVPQCPNHHCDAFVDSMGCCKKALIEFMKRHPNPKIAKLVQDIDTATNCNLIARFRLN